MLKLATTAGSFICWQHFHFVYCYLWLWHSILLKQIQLHDIKKFYSKSKCVASQQVRKSRPTFSIKVLICPLCYLRILNSWMISSGTLSCTGNANRAGQRSGPAQGWKRYEVLSSYTLRKRSDYWIDTPTKIKKCMNSIFIDTLDIKRVKTFIVYSEV